MLNPVNCSQLEYETLVEVTSQLTNLICRHDMDLSKLDREKTNSTKRDKKLEKEKSYKEEADKIASQLDEKAKRLFLAAQEKGASSWLSVLPLKTLGYSLTSQEFENTLCPIWLAHFRVTKFLCLW